MAGPWDNYAPSNAPAPSPASSSGPWGNYKQDPAAAAQAAADWRARTGAAPDVPTPFDTGLPESVPERTAVDRAEAFSSAAGDALTAGLMRTKAGTELALAGLPVAAGNQSLADQIFGNVAAQNEEANRLSQQAQGTSHGGAVAGNVLSFVPMVFGGEALSPERLAEGTTSLGGQVLSHVTHALPTAAGIGTNQATQAGAQVAEVGGTGAQAEKAYLAALPTDTAANLLPAAVPGSPVVRALTGAAIGAGGQAGAQEVQHLANPQFAQAPTLQQAQEGAGLGLLLGLATGGRGREPAEPIDPYLANYEKGQQERTAEAPAQRALPPPTTEASAEPSAPAPSGAPSAPHADETAFAAESFRQDPVTALNALDHATVKQIAQDAGFDVKPGEGKPQIIGKIMGQGRDYLESDVLPEYLANLSTGEKPVSSSAFAEPPAVQPREPQAAAIQPGTTIPVDRAGTAYTPEQGAQTFTEALDRARGISGRLPEPVTTVDSQGNAIDSASFTRALDQAREEAQNRLDMGITPDIERTQNERWIQQHLDTELRAQQLARQQEIERSRMENIQSDAEREQMVGLEDLQPELKPWWAAGPDAAARMAGERALKNAVPDAPSPLPATTPVDTSHDVTLGGGVAKDNSRVYIDKDIPQFIDVPKEDGSGMARVNAWQDIAFHEEVEKPELDRGTHYFDAHEQNANSGEDGYLRQKYGVTRAAVDKVLKPYLDAAAAKNPETSNIPTDLDRKPYEDGGDTAMLPEASNELAKLNIPEELHPQAIQFLGHVEDALQAGVDPSALHEIARNTADLPTKLQQIAQLTQEASGHATPSDTQAQNVPRETAASTLREVGEAGQPATQQGASEAGAANHPAEQQAALADRSNELGQEKRAQGKPASVLYDHRADWTPGVQGRAITEIDSLVQRYGGSTLADSIANDLREHTTAQLIGQQIAAPEDLAALASVYRNPAFETMRYIFVDRSGNVLGESAVSSRMPSTTKAFPTGEEDGAAWVKSMAPDGATGVWLVHNHPSGNPTASQGDIQVTQSLSIKLGDMAGAPKVQGHVILDHNTYGHIDALGEWQGVQKLAAGADIDMTRYGRGDFEMFATKVTSSDFAATTGKRIAAATPEDSSAVVIMDAQGRVTSVHTFPNDFLVTPRGAAMLSRLGQKRGAVGIGLVTSTENFAKHREAFQAGASRGLFRDATVVSPDGRPLSLNETAFFPHEQRKNYGQQSSGARARSQAGIHAYENAPEGTEPPLVSLSAVRRALADRGLSEDQIKAMTPEQLRAEQATMRRRSPPAPEEVQGGTATSIKDATVTEERAMKGRAAVEHDLSRSNPEAFATAKKRLETEPSYGGKLAADLITNPRPHTQEEAMVLALDRMRIINERRAAYDRLQEARASGDGLREAGADASVKMLDSQMEANDQAAELSGHETGAALQARRTMVKDDYTMAALVSRGKQAAGRDLRGPERAALEQRALEIEKREKALAEREAALQNARREPRKPKERAAAKSKFDSLAEKLKAIASKDQMNPGCVV